MRFLLDTMVVSEPAKPAPNDGALAWLERQALLDLAVSALSFGEVERGVARMEESPRKTALRQWLATTLPRLFDGRILPVDLEVAIAWGDLTAKGEEMGRPLHVVDGLLIATAQVHHLTIVTRNIKDFVNRGVEIHNPYH